MPRLDQSQLTWDSFFMKAVLARRTVPMLKVAVLRAEMERVKANMFVLGALTGADTGEESFRGLRSSFPQPELSEDGEEEAEEVSEEKEESEDVGEPDSESSPWIALSSSMDASWILNFPSMMTVPGPTVACSSLCKSGN